MAAATPPPQAPGKIRCVLGTMTMGWDKASDRVDDAVSSTMLDEFLEVAGNDELDTAIVYASGETERILGRVLLPTRGKIAIKANNAISRIWALKDSLPPAERGRANGGLHAPYVRIQVEASLSALRRDRADILYLHAPDSETPLAETLQACDQLHCEGKFTELGMSNYPAWEVVHAWHLCSELGLKIRPTVYQGMYNALTRDVEKELFPVLRNFGIRFYAYNPLAGGLLTGKHDFSQPPPPGRFNNNKMYEERFWTKEYFDAVECVGEACRKERYSLCQAAFVWLLHHSGLRDGDAVIIGASSVGHLQQNVGYMREQGPLPPAVLQALDDAWRKLPVAAIPSYERGHSRY